MNCGDYSYEPLSSPLALNAVQRKEKEMDKLSRFFLNDKVSEVLH
jgi:hypothetical protein